MLDRVLERTNALGVGLQAFAMRSMPCAVVRPLAQEVLCCFEILLFREYGQPLPLKFCVSHGVPNCLARRFQVGDPSQRLRLQRGCVVSNLDLAGPFDVRHSTVKRGD